MYPYFGSGEPRYDFTDNPKPVDYDKVPICLACWRNDNDGKWPTFFPLDAPTEKCHRCGSETESGLRKRIPKE